MEKFKTKKGFCYLLEDRLILTKDSALKSLKSYEGKRSAVPYIIYYSAVGGILVTFSIMGFVEKSKFPLKGDSFSLYIFMVLGLLCLVNAVFSFGKSMNQTILYDSIKNVKYVAAVKFITRAYFVVQFEDFDGKVRKRLIMLKGSMSGAEKEVPKAVDLMIEASLLKI